MRYLFILNNFNIGGPQKSLLSLLHYFPSDTDIDLLILNSEDQLTQYLPRNIKVLKGDWKTQILMMKKKDITLNLITSFINGSILGFKMLFKLIISKINNKSTTYIKQEFWKENRSVRLQPLEKEYDFAIAVSGGHSMMYLVDFVKAKQKIGWIRTEYQNLGRDLSIDDEYFSKLDRVLSVSNMCSTKFCELFPQYKNKIITFYNPLPFKMYGNLEEPIVKFKENNIKYTLTSISRLDPHKGFDILIEIAKNLKMKDIPFIWNIYGSGLQKKKIEEDIIKNNLGHFVKLKGFEFNTGEILKNTDILIHLSKFEGKSNAIDEAKYYEVPIITTNFPTVYEQIEHCKTGVIVNYEKQEITHKIEDLLTNETLKKELKENLKKEKAEMNKRDVFSEFIKSIGAV